ncbi:MAG: TIM barrel protein [bacterium]
MRQYRYLSVHAPSRFSAAEEEEIIALLAQASALSFFIIVHPDSMHRVQDWEVLGEWLCLENMDKRKDVGRTAEELMPFFDKLPLAGLCFDIAHARQVDGSMIEAYRILQSHHARVRQVHISEVSTSSRHTRMSFAAMSDFREIAAFIPDTAAIIVEAPVEADEIELELASSRAVLLSNVQQ